MNEREVFERALLNCDLTRDEEDRYRDPDVHNMWLGWETRSEIKPHCVTCQCTRIDPEKPAPENPFSKPWHMTAGGKPPSSG